jgi:phospholipase/carboxylesterase
MIKISGFQYEVNPARQTSDKLMIVLHGKGDSLVPFQEFDEELRMQDLNFLLLNAPQKFFGGYSWYKEPPFLKDEVLEVREKMLQLLDELLHQGWKPENIFLFGFSQGCLISADVALHFPYQLGGVIGISGYFQFFPRWRSSLRAGSLKTPWLLTHGFRDEILPLKTTKFGVKKLKSVGINIDWVEMNKGHVLKEQEYPIIRKWLRSKMKSQIKYLPDSFQRVPESSRTDLVLR